MPELKLLSKMPSQTPLVRITNRKSSFNRRKGQGLGTERCRF